MGIERNPKAKIKFEGTSLVIEKAFTLGGVYHNIVLTDGNRALSKNNLTWAPQSQICEEITGLYFKCLEKAMTECELSGPLEGVRFVYKKKPESTEGSLTQMFWRQSLGHEAPFTIGTLVINKAMEELRQKFSIYGTGKPEGALASKPKASPSASSSPASGSLIPDFLLGDEPAPVKVSPSSGTPSSQSNKAALDEEEAPSSSSVKVAPPLAADEERRVALKRSLLDQHNAAQKLREVGRVAGRLESLIPGVKPFRQLWEAVRGRGSSPTPEVVD
jgi:hypothetical protein